MSNFTKESVFCSATSLWFNCVRNESNDLFCLSNGSLCKLTAGYKVQLKTVKDNAAIIAALNDRTEPVEITGNASDSRHPELESLLEFCRNGGFIPSQSRNGIGVKLIVTESKNVGRNGKTYNNFYVQCKLHRVTGGEMVKDKNGNERFAGEYQKTGIPFNFQTDSTMEGKIAVSNVASQYGFSRLFLEWAAELNAKSAAWKFVLASFIPVESENELNKVTNTFNLNSEVIDDNDDDGELE